MDVLFFLATAVAGIHTFTYAGWLKRNGNKAGAWGVWLLTAAAMGVAGYRLF